MKWAVAAVSATTMAGFIAGWLIGSTADAGIEPFVALLYGGSAGGFTALGFVALRSRRRP